MVGYLSMLTLVDYLPLLTNQWWIKSEFLRPGKINKYKFSVLSLNLRKKVISQTSLGHFSPHEAILYDLAENTLSKEIYLKSSQLKAT